MLNGYEEFSIYNFDGFKQNSSDVVLVMYPYPGKYDYIFTSVINL